MDDGSKLGKGAKIATKGFSLDDLKFLCQLLKVKYNLDVSIHSPGGNKGNTLYIKSTSMMAFTLIIKPHVLPSMYYKLGHY